MKVFRFGRRWFGFAYTEEAAQAFVILPTIVFTWITDAAGYERGLKLVYGVSSLCVFWGSKR